MDAFFAIFTFTLCGCRMKFIFTCPKDGRSFDSDDFKITEDHGVTVDEHNRKRWNAKVELLFPCPFCSRMHVFDVNELACSFGKPSD